MEKILYTTPELMHPTVSGPTLRVENSIKALSRISELHLLVRRAKECIGNSEAENYYKKYCTQFVYTPSVIPIKKNLIYRIKKMFLGKHFAQKKQSDSDFIISYAKENNINIIWFGYGNISFQLMKKIKEKAPNLKLVCDTDSVWSRFILRELPYVKDSEKYKKIELDGHQKELEEKQWTEFCDVVTAVSEVDAEYYRKFTQDKNKIKIFSNVIDVDMYSGEYQEPINFKKPNIYFAGSYWEGCPMEQAARWVIRDIFPIVRKTIPDAHLYLIGNNSDKILADIVDPNISITGRLDSVLPYLCNSTVAIVALNFESGTRFKILEAGACGIPIVSTTLGAEGIPVINNENIFIADSAEDFANAIVKVIKNPELSQNVANNLKQYIIKNYSIDKHVAEAREIINFINKK